MTYEEQIEAKIAAYRAKLQAIVERAKQLAPVYVKPTPRPPQREPVRSFYDPERPDL